jgi:hypothetical protein
MKRMVFDNRPERAFELKVTVSTFSPQGISFRAYGIAV